MPGQNAEKQAWDEKMPEKNARPKSLKKTLNLTSFILYFSYTQKGKSASITNGA